MIGARMVGLAVGVPVGIVAWATLLALLERRYPYNRGYRVLRAEFWIDLVAYLLVQSYLCGLAIAAFVSWMDGATGWSRAHVVSGWSIAAQLGFFLVVHDLWQYWFHRLEHRNRFFWRIHEAAHAPLEVDWLAGARSHALEILIAQTFEFAPMVWLGAAPEVFLWKGLIDVTQGMFNHCNIDLPQGRWLWIFNGPHLHRWHHDLDTPKGGVNLGTKLAIWDVLFGTRYLPPPSVRCGRFGLKRSDAFPHGSYLAQLVYPFRPFRRFRTTRDDARDRH